MSTPNEQSLAKTLAGTSRDEATTGKSNDLTNPAVGYADADQPVQRPPEGIPEPRPTEPTMGQTKRP